ncbi:Nn.00g029080.m01.CDS01 [Neocucurbitaria sp. VM-36]
MLLKHLTIILFLMATLLGLTVAKDSRKKPKNPKYDPDCGAPFCARDTIARGNEDKREEGKIGPEVSEDVPEMSERNSRRY